MSEESVVQLTRLTYGYDDLLSALNARSGVRRYLGAIKFPSPWARDVYVVSENDVAVGVVGIVPSGDRFGMRGASELICALVHEAEHRGIGTRACQSLLEKYGATVFGCVHPTNEASAKMVSKLGFTPTGLTARDGETVWQWTFETPGERRSGDECSS